MKQSDKIVKFSDFSGGVNEVDTPAMIQDNQMALGSFNMAPTRTGMRRRRAFARALDTDITGTVNGVYNIPGEIAYTVNSDSLYDVVNDTTRALSTDIATVYNGLGVCDFGRDILFWIGKRNSWWCDLKTSGAKVYPIGIQTISISDIEVIMGSSSLINGDYSIIISLSHKRDGFGQYWGRGTAATYSVNDTYRILSIITPDATYEQATHFTLWIKAPGESVHYSYGDYTSFGGTTIEITDASLKNASMIYEVEVANNVSIEYDFGGTVVQNYFGMTIHNEQLFICASHNDVNNRRRVYFSRKATSPADLFKFDDDAFIDYPFKIYALFSLGEHLYVSTQGGLIRQPYGDPNNLPEFVDHNVYYNEWATLLKYKGRIFGMTNAGVRMFDGNGFSQSLSATINTDYRNIYSNTTPLGAFMALDWWNSGEITYHWGVWKSGSLNEHCVISLDRVIQLGGSPVVRYDITMLTGFHVNNKTYIVQSNESQSHVIADRGATGTSTALDSNVIKGIALSKVSTFVDFAIYTKRKYINTGSVIRSREVRVEANKITNNENSCGLSIQVKAFEL